jgi:cytidine deaminase
MQTLTIEQKKQLVELACEARKNAYIPYCKYAVGAALLTATGQIFTGANIDNASYGANICGERVAVHSAVAQGYREFSAIAVVSRNGASPCGICRQVLFEFGSQTLVLIANENGEILEEMNLQDLLPRAFGPKYLGENQ